MPKGEIYRGLKHKSEKEEKMVTRWRQKLVAVATILIVLTLLLTMVPACAPKPTPEKPIELSFAIWCGPKSAHSPSFEAWAKDLEERSGGRIKVNLAWGGAMGKPSEHFDMAASGVADIAATAAVYCPGRLPMSNIMTCPISVPSAEVGSKAYFELYKKGYLDKELADVEVCFLWTTASYHLFWAEEPVTSLAEVEGKKVRAAGGAFVELAKAMGATPVSLPSTDVYVALEKKIIDGLLGPYSIVTGYNLQEVSKYALELGVCTVPFGVFMNKGVYEGLPIDIRAIIDEMRDSGKYNTMAGKGHDTHDAKGRELMAGVGAEISSLSPADREELGRLVTPLWDKWIADNEAKGLPARKAARELYSILKNLGVTDPLCGYTP